VTLKNLCRQRRRIKALKRKAGSLIFVTANSRMRTLNDAEQQTRSPNRYVEQGFMPPLLDSVSFYLLRGLGIHSYKYYKIPLNTFARWSLSFLSLKPRFLKTPTNIMVITENKNILRTRYYYLSNLIRITTLHVIW
jgi:hypothetical protein